MVPARLLRLWTTWAHPPVGAALLKAGIATARTTAENRTIIFIKSLFYYFVFSHWESLIARKRVEQILSSGLLLAGKRSDQLDRFSKRPNRRVCRVLIRRQQGHIAMRSPSLAVRL